MQQVQISIQPCINAVVMLNKCNQIYGCPESNECVHVTYITCVNIHYQDLITISKSVIMATVIWGQESLQYESKQFKGLISHNDYQFS